ncbi:MAG: methyltransferase [Gaiellales bacterium]|nr:methyltransferase [Gaiellales bacterium]
MAIRTERAVLIRVPAVWAEVTGAMLFDVLGPFEERAEGDTSGLLFYPERYGASIPTLHRILELLPDHAALQSAVRCKVVEVAGGWEDNWRSFFVPLEIGRLYVRPPWEPASRPPLLDVCINPGLAFGTGLHETTRGVLRLLAGEETCGAVGAPGALLDAGCGSGILSIAASRLGYGPIRAFDADPLAVEAARANCAANGIEVEVVQATVAAADADWLRGATVAANIAEKPVLELLGRVAELGSEGRPRRLMAAGLLQGEQECAVAERAVEGGWRVAAALRDGEWVTLDLVT